MSLKSCNIIYGYIEHCLDLYQESPNDYVLLIEPRGNVIDLLKKEKIGKNIVLISKMLSENDKMTESILYFNKEENEYFTKNKELLVNGTNYFNIKKYTVFTTSINNLILQYNIQNINSFSININIQNCNKILDNIIPFNHIISNIIIHPSVLFFSNNCKIIENFNKDKENDLKFSHKNLHVKLPNIGMFFNGNLKNNKEITLLIQQYKMNLIITKKKDSFIVPYPESITIINNNIYNTYSKIYHENIIKHLDCIFNNSNNSGNSDNSDNSINSDNSDNSVLEHNIDNNLNNINNINISDLEIIIQFNPKYFDNNKTLQIMYPLKDNVLYINKLYDIIYGTKNCIYMLYQIIKSKYFSDFLELKKLARPKLFTIFSKLYFFEYISKIFVVKEF